MIKKIELDELAEGMIIAEDVSTPFGAVIASEKQVVDKKLIDLLKANRIRVIKVKADDSEKDDVDDALSYIAEDMIAARNMVVFRTEEGIKPVVDAVIKIIREAPQVFDYVELIKQLHDYSDTVFAHSSNVALICFEFAMWRKMPPEAVKEVTLAGFIHDIGKLQLPLGILDAARPLTEAEFAQVKKHSINGYMMIKNTEIPESIKRAVLDHHERCDGSGYPMGYDFNRISEYGRMIAIADSYEAMTAKRACRDKICPFKIASIMVQELDGKFDMAMLEDFLMNILGTYVGSKVTLSNGYTAKLKGINKQSISKPVIELAGRTIDLSTQVGAAAAIHVVGIA